MKFVKKSWLCPALFFCIVPYAAFVSFSTQAQVTDAYSPEHISKIANSPTWQALLHIKDNRPRISDPQFILSTGSFSPAQELYKTLALFKQKEKLGYCRFPARHYFLSQYFDLPQGSIGDSDTQEKCNGFSTYQRKVPFDDLSLIYASEVLSSASSMMGHVFIKATGRNDNQNNVAHSVSFFTEYETYNPFKLIFDGLVGGMNGFFIVRPYQNELMRYTEKEQRNVFEYDLAFTDFETELIKLHIWELKDIEISYLFQSYNCATLTLYVLSLGDPILKQAEKLFVSPADVVKAASKSNLIKNASVTLSTKWNLSLLKQELGPSLSKKVEQLLLVPAKTKFLQGYSQTQQLLAAQYLQLLLDDAVISQTSSAAAIAQLRSFLKATQVDDSQQQIEIDFKSYNNPIDSQQDSIVTSSYLRREDNTFVDLTFLPASHYFRARNKQFFAESQLKIGEVIVRVNTGDMHANINSLTLYSVTSLVPSTSLQPELSGNFYLGYKQNYTEALRENGFVTIEGGFGKTRKLHQDIMVYGLLNVGVSLNFDDQLLFVAPKFGAILNLAHDVKFSVSHKYKNHRLLEDGLHLSSAEFSWAGAKEYSLSVEIESAKTQFLRQNTMRLSFDYHF